MSGRARAQACCAGSGAVTPARLAIHEWALVAAQIRPAAVVGSFDANGRYSASPRGASELDLEEDLFGAVRFVERGQVALFVPLVQTRRTSQGLSEFGGGLGDVNASGRYDFTRAGTSRIVPGVALLAGVTLPTGTPADAPGLGPLATGATGIGAFQLNLGLALEQAFGAWLVNVSAIAAQRTSRTVGGVHERLGTQWTALATVAYTFASEIAVAAGASYAIDGEATINGVDSPGTAHRLPTFSLSGVVPLSDSWRLQGALFDNVQVSVLGLNEPASLGLSAALVRSWM